VRYGVLPTGGECGDRASSSSLRSVRRRLAGTGSSLRTTCSIKAIRKADMPHVAGARSDRSSHEPARPWCRGDAAGARRRPWNVARDVSAVDQLSEGRAILGVGLGDVGDYVVADASFTHFGEERDARRRAERLDEALEIVRGPLDR
jgi:Luciferase-like monooxygenase